MKAKRNAVSHQPADTVSALPHLAYDLTEASVVAGVSVTTLRRAIRDDHLKVTRIGTRIIIPVENLRTFTAQDWQPEKKDAA
jgi:excisionase family DNA binding protein